MKELQKAYEKVAVGALCPFCGQQISDDPDTDMVTDSYHFNAHPAQYVCSGDRSGTVATVIAWYYNGSNHGFDKIVKDRDGDLWLIESYDHYDEVRASLRPLNRTNIPDVRHELTVIIHDLQVRLGRVKKACNFLDDECRRNNWPLR